MCYLSVKCPYDHCAAWSPAKLPGQGMPGQGLLTLPSPLQEPESSATTWGRKRESRISRCGCQTRSTWVTLLATRPHPESLKKMRTRMVNDWPSKCWLPFSSIVSFHAHNMSAREHHPSPAADEETSCDAERSPRSHSWKGARTQPQLPLTTDQASQRSATRPI